MSKLAGKRFWLVGASAGIGRELALALAKAGAAVIVSARSEDALKSLLAELAPVKTARGGHAAVVCDVADSASTQQAFGRAGDMDGVVYCAAAYEPMSARWPQLEALETIVNVNFTGALRVLAACVPAFCRRGSGHIVLLGSISGYRGLPDAWGYSATKAALIHLAENLRCDVRGAGVAVQVCNPGFVATRLTDKNRFRMPFLMTPAQAAQRIVRGMGQRRFEIAFPFVMSTGLKLLASLPRAVFFALLALAAGKPEGKPEGEPEGKPEGKPEKPS